MASPSVFRRALPFLIKLLSRSSAVRSIRLRVPTHAFPWALPTTEPSLTVDTQINPTIRFHETRARILSKTEIVYKSVFRWKN